ncbi:putative minor capsid protein [Latilactobacillus sakei]
MMPRMPKMFANQTITLERYLGKDGLYNKPEYTEPLIIDHCIVQPQTIYSGSNNQREITANAVIFLYAGVTTPLPELTKADHESKVTFEGDTYTVKTIVDNRDPFSNALWSYELEVL